MNRSFPSAREALVVLAGALLYAAGCTPDQSVKAGPPQLMEFTIVAGGAATTVKHDTPDCATTTTDGATCDPANDGLCRQSSGSDWCTCVADMTATPPTAAWSCAPFANVTAVIAVFDRLLDTAPLDPGTDPGRKDLITATTTPAIELSTDYSATGDPNGLVFNLFGPAFFGNFRANGPSLFAQPLPEFPSDAVVMVKIDKTKVRAKDGTTPFEGTGMLMSGELSFKTAPFTMSVAAPDAMAMDPTAATVMFTNFVDPTVVGPLIIASTSANTAIPVKAVHVDGSDASASTFAVTPTSGAWPAGEITIAVDATAKNLLDQTITAPLSGKFTAP